MGNTESDQKFEHGEVYLQLENSSCVPGGRIAGKVHLSLSQPYPALGLSLEIKGKEKVKWESGVDHTHGEKEEFWDKMHDIIKPIITLFVFERSVVLPGQYTFPFDIGIPKGLPSSVYFSGGFDSKAVIEYSIKAILNQPEEWDNKPMSFKTPFVVDEPEQEFNEEQKTKSGYDIRSFWGWVNNGRSELQIQLTKPSYSTDENCILLCHINNLRCNVRINRMRVRLIQDVHLSGQFLLPDHRNSYHVHEEFYDGLEPNQSTGIYGRRIDIPLPDIKGTVNETAQKESYIYSAYKKKEKEMTK